MTVLQYYNKPSDSLKHKATVFLIENMLFKRSFNKSFYRNNKDFFTKVKNIWKDSSLIISTKEKKYDSLFESMQIESTIINLKQNENLQVIKSEYLIENIELAFEAWEKFHWSKGITFEAFCNYILPYRVFEEPIGNWRKTLMERYSWVQDSIKDPSNLREATILINKSFNRDMEYFSSLKNIPNALDFNELDSLKIGKCDHLVIMNIYALRAMGIPVASESAIWANHRAGHTWCAVQETNKPLFVFDPLYPPKISDSIYLNGDFNYIPENNITKMKASKVHRSTYKNYYNNLPFLSDNSQRYITISSSISINRLDVTSEYNFSQADLNLKLTSQINEDILFLNVFNKNSWEKIAWSIKGPNESYDFYNLATELVYLPTFQNDYVSIPPFIFKKSGAIHYLKPNMDNTKLLKLKRKYFTRAYVQGALDKMIGGVFQGSNQKNFHETENLFKITAAPEPRTNTYSFISKNKYRYVRFLTPNNVCRVAELNFYGKSSLSNKKADTRLTGNLISSSYEKNSGPEKILDGDVLTYFVSNEESGGWIGFDLGEIGAARISSVHFYPPNDGNSIEVDDLYELFYWNQGKWKSLGQKKAVAEELLFENCPDNALFILKNNTKGSDVRIFTYEDNEQIWW
jgi:hypothetical protein